MRLPVALLVLLACVLGPRTVSAEKAKAKESAKVYSRAGEAGKVVLKVKEGQVMRIDRKEGRWYKVRVAGRTGWIPRTKVELLEEEEFVRNTRRRPFVDGRGTKRGFGGDSGPTDRVGADAVDPDTGGGGGGGDGEDDTEADTEDDTEDEPPVKKPTGKKKPPKVAVKEDPEEDAGDTEGDEPKITDDDEGGEVVDDRPRVRVTGKVTVFAEADDDGEEADWSVKSGAVLFLSGKKGKFTEVEDDEGNLGYILSSKVEAVESEGGDEPGGRGGSKMGVSGRLGVTIIQQGLRSDGPPMLPDNYNLSTSAATVALGGTYLRPYKKKFVVGAEAAFDLAKAVPGIKAPNNQTTGITLYHLNARGMFGYDLKRKSGMMAFARLGLRYQSYQVSNVGDLDKNTAKLPSEILTAPSLGAALVIPKLTGKIGLRLSVDAVLVGASLKQTKRLEDGNKASMKGAIVGAGFTYRWKSSMDIQATYDLNLAKYNFGTPIAGSMRGHMGTGAVTRSDLFHGVTVGVSKAF